MKQRIKINAIAIVVSLLLISLFPRLIIRHSAGIVDEIIEMLGLSLIFLGQLVRVSARGYKAEHSQSGDQLIENGPYGMVRHPMYAGIILIGLGVVLSVCNIWALLLFICMFLLRYLFLFKKEEQGLVRVFGDQYRAYQKRVPRLVPRPALFLSGDIFRHLPLKMRWFKSEAVSIIPVLFIVFVIEFSEAMTLGGGKFPMNEFLGFLAVLAAFLLLILFLVRKHEASSAHRTRPR